MEYTLIKKTLHAWMLVLTSVVGTPLTACATTTQADIALQGQVVSPDEGQMEGVVVTAQEKGSTISISVLTNAQGHFPFPRSKLRAGVYALRMYATGYDLEKPVTATVNNSDSLVINIKLQPTRWQES